MSTRTLRLFLPVLMPFALLSSFAYGQNYVPGEVIVKLKGQGGTQSSYAFLGKAATDKAMVLKNSFGKMNMYHFALGKGQSVEQTIQELKADPDVEYAEPNFLLQKTQDVGMQQSFSADEIHAEALQSQAEYMASGVDIGLGSVWQSVSSSGPPNSRPIIAVIDTGLDINHFVVTGTQSLWTNPGEVAGNGVDDDGNGYVDDIHGWNFIAGNGAMLDDDGHGTHVTGIILSVDQNIYSTPLNQSRVQIMPLKFLDENGSGSTSSAIKAIYYAVRNGATILNNSWGGTSYSSALHDAVKYSYDNRVLFVAAAGNAGVNTDSNPMYPASLTVPNILSVAALSTPSELAFFSNYGETSVDLGSPGVSILSIIPDNMYGYSSGTSMAAPFVSGTAGQMAAEAPGMQGYQLRSLILSTIASNSGLSGKVSTSGRLNSANAVTASKTATLDPTQPAYTVQYLTESRGPASAAGGCGTVAKLGGSGLPPAGTALAVTFLLLLPILLQFALRKLSPQDLRKHERFKINSEVRISVGDKELVGSVSSISLGGAQVNTTALLKDGGLITLSIASPDGAEKVEVAGRVVWSETNKAYGVAFDQTPQTVLSRISDWTRNLQKT